MALTEEKIRELIKASIPDAKIEIKDLAGDNNHYSAKISSKMFNGKSKVEEKNFDRGTNRLN